MTFHGVHGKPPQTWRHKTTEIYQLTILKGRSLKSRCQQGHAPSKGSRKESALVSSSKFPITFVIHSWLVATSPQSLPPLSHGLLPVCLLFFLFLDFFLMWIIFKVYMEFVKILFLFYILLFGPPAMWDLSFPTRDGTHNSCIRRCSLNHRTASDVPFSPYKDVSHWI